MLTNKGEKLGLWANANEWKDSAEADPLRPSISRRSEGDCGVAKGRVFIAFLVRCIFFGGRRSEKRGDFPR